MAGVARITGWRYGEVYREQGLDGLLAEHWAGPESGLLPHLRTLEAGFAERPPRTVAEAVHRIEQLTGVQRQPAQSRRVSARRAGPALATNSRHSLPAKKNVAEHIQVQADFLKDHLEPRLAAARAGQRDLFFVDAAHFVRGTFLCYLWCPTRLFVKAAAGRQRDNVRGAWNAVTNTRVAVTNTTVVNSETACELLRKIAAQSVGRPVTLVLDNARYQYCQVVRNLADQLGIELLFLPSYSPNLNLIERLWKFVKKKALRGKYYVTFADFRAGIDNCLAQIETTHRPALATLLTHNFQKFDDVSLLAG